MISFKVPRNNLRNVNLFYSSLASTRSITNTPNQSFNEFS